MYSIETDFERIEKEWLDRCKQIQNSPLSVEGANKILEEFEKERYRILTNVSNKNYAAISQRVKSIGTELQTSLSIARSKFELEKKSIWDRIKITINNVLV